LSQICDFKGRKWLKGNPTSREINGFPSENSMKNGTNKRIRVYLETLGGGISYERLFRALSLILSEEDLMKYLSNNQNNTLSSSLNAGRTVF
jgi:hypothetical protein